MSFGASDGVKFGRKATRTDQPFGTMNIKNVPSTASILPSAVAMQQATVSGMLSFLDPNKKSPFLDHLCRFFSKVSGTDKTLMVVQYFSKILIWHYTRRAKANVATRLGNLSGSISDLRMLLRFYGILPIIQWAKSIEQNPPPSRRLLQLERAQVASMICYYPLEHVYWLAAHKIIPLAEATVNRIGMWSCRFWAFYVVLQFAHLGEEYRLLQRKRQQRLIKTQNDGDLAIERGAAPELDAECHSILVNTIVNTSYLPLTLHWSVESSDFPDIGVGLFGTVAALAQFWTNWESA